MAALFAVFFAWSNVAVAAPPSKEDLKSLYTSSVWFDPKAVASICTNAASVAVQAGENKRAAFIYFVERGLTPEQSAGLVGNLEAESGVTPDINEQNPTVAGSRGGYGIAQWTAGRRVALESFATVSGQDVRTLQFQLDYLWNQELLISYKSSVLDPLKASTTVQQASDIVLTKFEIPGVIINGTEAAKTQLKNKRAALGQAIFELYGAEAATASPAGTATVSSACGGSGAAGSFVGFPLQTTKTRMQQLNGSCFSDTTKKMCDGDHPYAAFDIMADTGTPVLSVLAGAVQGRFSDKCGGTMISIYSQDQDVTVSYLHMAPDVSVGVGDTVTAGQTIGKVGSDAAACDTGSHLHIDAAPGAPRPGCRREACPAANQAKFLAGEAKINLSSGLYEGYTKLQTGETL